MPGEIAIEKEEITRAASLADDSISCGTLMNEGTSVPEFSLPALNFQVNPNLTALQTPATATVSDEEIHRNFMEKPKLYQSMKNEESSVYLWSDLGTFDEQDLDAESYFLLVQPEGMHFLWVGNKFKYTDRAVGWQPDPMLSEDCNFCRTTASEIQCGDLADVNSLFNVVDFLDDAKCALIFEGAESDEWWEVFDKS